MDISTLLDGLGRVQELVRQITGAYRHFSLSEKVERFLKEKPQVIEELAEIPFAEFRRGIQIHCDEARERLLFNYKDYLQYARLWTPFARCCRGIIFDSQGNLLAFPFHKFFNFGETQETQALPLSQPYEVAEKMDGVLGIIYLFKGDIAISTRGRFRNPFIDAANEILSGYAEAQRRGLRELLAEYTLMAEIIHPKSRIVVDYGDKKALVLVGARHRQTNRLAAFSQLQLMAEGQRLGLEPVPYYPTLDLWTAKATHAEPTQREGFVVLFPNSQLLVKLKTDDYTEFIRLQRHLTYGKLIDLYDEGGRERVEEWLVTLPDEIMVKGVAMLEEVDLFFHKQRQELTNLFRQFAHITDRKSFALSVQSLSNPRQRAAMFALLDGKRLERFIAENAREEFRGRT